MKQTAAAKARAYRIRLRQRLDSQNLQSSTLLSKDDVNAAFTQALHNIRHGDRDRPIKVGDVTVPLSQMIGLTWNCTFPLPLYMQAAIEDMFPELDKDRVPYSYGTAARLLKTRLTQELTR